jgi:hypothetical protein
MKIIVHEANGLQIGQRHEDGYVNATALSKAHYQATKQRRDPNHWLALERTKQSIEHLSRSTEISVDQLVIKIMTGKNENRGTYIHPRLAVRFAIWLSDDFGYMVEEWVNQWMLAAQNPLPSPQPQNNLPPDESISTALDLLNEVERQINLARLYRHAAHNITDQPLISKGINRVVHRAMHEQGNVLNDCLSKLASLREAMNQAVDEAPVQLSSATIEPPVIEVQPTPESKQLPNYLTLVRKETRLRASQLEQLTILARKLNKQRQGKGDRITENTLIRLAIDTLLNICSKLNSTEILRLVPHPEQTQNNLPTYLTLTRKEARLTEDQFNQLTSLARILNRQKQSCERITENTLIRVAIDLLLNQSKELNSRTQMYRVKSR